MLVWGVSDVEMEGELLLLVEWVGMEGRGNGVGAKDKDVDGGSCSCVVGSIGEREGGRLGGIELRGRWS